MTKPILCLVAVSLFTVGVQAQADHEPLMYRMNASHQARYAATPITEQPRIKWKVDVDGPVFSSPLAYNSLVYVGSGHNRFYALDAETGAEAWSFTTLGAVHSSPAVKDGVVYFGDFGGVFYALDAATGEERWRYRILGERHWGTKGVGYKGPKEKYFVDTEDFFLASPVLDDTHVYYASGNGNVYALDLQTGERAWYFQTNDVVHTTPALADGRLYVGGWDTFFYGIDAETGTLAWKLQTGIDTVYYNQTGIQSAPVVSDGIVYFGSRDSHLYAVDATSGEVVWKKHNGGSWIIVSPLVDDQHVYYTTSDSKKFMALDKTTGEVRHELPTLGWGFSSPIAVGDLVYFGSMSGDMTAVDTRTQRIAWRFLTDAAQADVHDVLNEQGVMDTNKLYANYNVENALDVQNTMFSVGAILSTPFPHEDTLIFGTADGYVYAIH